MTRTDEVGTSSDIEVIRDPLETQERYSRLVGWDSNGITLLLPSAAAFHRERESGIIELLSQAVARRTVVRVLSPADSQDMEMQKEELRKQGIDMRLIGKQSPEAMVKILTVGREAALVMELKDDTKQSFVDAVGIALYVTNKSIVSSYVSLFETLWRESEVREREARSKRQSQLLQDILAHDIRNFNQASRLSAEILREELSDNADVRNLTETLLQSIDDSTQLVERAKKLGRILSDHSPVLHPVDVNASLAKSIVVVRRAYPGKNISVSQQGSREAEVLADDFLEEAFVNLLSNAVRYTEGNDVPIEIKLDEEQVAAVKAKGETGERDLVPSSRAISSAVVRAAAQPRYWHIAIIDRGTGIPDEMKGKVFDRYLQSARGSGLGMSIVHALVMERYHGKVSIENRIEDDPSKGTVMHVWLPRP